MSWIKQEAAGNLWKPEEAEETLEGEVISIDEKAAYGTQLSILDEKGNEVTTPGHTNLIAQLDKVRKGQRVKIVFKGSVPTKKGNPLRLYEVFIHFPDQKE